MVGTVHGVFHPVVSASDLSEAVHYFRDLLGLSVTFDDYHDPAAISALFGYPEPRLHSVIVSCPDGSEIELVEFESPRGRTDLRREAADAGLLSINLRVSGIEAIVERLDRRRLPTPIGDRGPGAARRRRHQGRDLPRARRRDDHPGRPARRSSLAQRLGTGGRMPEMDRSVVVTGCGAGIGRAIFERLAQDGWAVAGVELSAAQVADARTMLSDAGLPGVVIEGDAADRDVLAAARAAAQGLAPLAWLGQQRRCRRAGPAARPRRRARRRGCSGSTSTATTGAAPRPSGRSSTRAPVAPS